MKNFIKIFCVIFPCVVFATTPNQELVKLLSGFQSMQANFVQVILHGNSKATPYSSGKMALHRPGKFRWEIQKPSEQLIIADGSNIWIYDADLQQATKQKMDYKQPANPAMLLSGSIADLQKDFIITKLKKTVNGKWFELRARAKNGIFQNIQIQFVNNKLKIMYIVDNLGQHIMLTFSNVRTNPMLKPTLFEFKAPPDVYIIEN